MKNFIKYTILLFLTVMCSACTHLQDENTITYATWGSQSEIKILKPLIDEFESQSGIKVELIHIPQNYFQKLHLLFASKQPPDVLFINNFYLPLYAQNDLLENLTPYFKEEINNELYFNNAIKALSYNENVLAIPRDISNLVVYYNKDLFREREIPFPKTNWTYGDFLTIGKNLTTDKRWGVSFEEHPLFWEHILWANGAELFNNDGQLTLNTTTTKEALQFYIELRTKHHIAPQKIDSANRTMTQMFLEQRIAMLVSGRWVVPKLREEAKFDWDIINTPNGKLGSIAASDASGWAVAKQSRNKENAVKLIKFLTSDKAIKEMTKDGLITPALKSVAYSETFLDKKKPQNAIIFLNINQNAKVEKIPKDYNIKVEKLLKVLEPYFTGKENISPTTKFGV